MTRVAGASAFRIFPVQQEGPGADIGPGEQFENVADLVILLEHLDVGIIGLTLVLQHAFQFLTLDGLDDETEVSCGRILGVKQQNLGLGIDAFEIV